MKIKKILKRNNKIKKQIKKNEEIIEILKKINNKLIVDIIAPCEFCKLNNVNNAFCNICLSNLYINFDRRTNDKC